MVLANKRQLLEKAVRLSSRAALAAALKASDGELEQWMQGRRPLPDRKLLALADFLAAIAGNVGSAQAQRPQSPPRATR